MILGNFDHAFLINMDGDTERLERSLERLGRISIAAERLPAVVPADSGAFATASRRGCAESHRRAVELARERSYDSVLVFEDDVVFRDGFLKTWETIGALLQGIEYDLFYFYRWMSIAWKPWDLRIVPIDGTPCTHAYAVHRRFYDAALEMHAQNERRGRVADRLFRAPEARIYAPTYNLAGQDSGVSRVSGDAHPRRWSGHTDRIPRIQRWIWF